MNELEQYISKVSGETVRITPVSDAKYKLPFYLGEAFDFSRITIYRHDFILAQWNGGDFTVGQLGKQVDVIEQQFDERVILVLPDTDAITRSRLVERRINFICPGKQMFIPYLFLDLREKFVETIKEKNNDILTPSAQLIILHHLYNLRNGLVGSITSFKQLAALLDYSQMAITKAAAELNRYELCEIGGTKEKTFIFSDDKKAFWDKCESHLGSPVMKTVFVDYMPDIGHLNQAGEDALSFYSDLSSKNVSVYAIGKFQYQFLQKSGNMPPQNDKEGEYKLEIWNYQPEVLILENEWRNNVDPLSLYLSLRHVKDERVQMALDQILQKFIYG